MCHSDAHTNLSAVVLCVLQVPHYNLTDVANASYHVTVLYP